MADQLRVHATSNLTVMPSRRHHNTTFTCLTHNPAQVSPAAAKVDLSIEYPPEITLHLHPSKF